VAKIKLDESHRYRENLVKTVRAKVSGIEDAVWDSINFYYSEIRNDFYHVSAGKTITDTAILDYLDTVEFVIDAAFGTKVGQLVREASPSLPALPVADESAPAAKPLPRLTDLSDPIDKVIVAVVSAKPKGVEEINEYFKKQGDKLRLKPDQLTNILARNSGSKKFFYFSRESKAWGLSALGEFKLTQLTEGSGNGK
jgi:hypothetical protein